MKKTLCILTIGQSPRTDMLPAISTYFPTDLHVIEKGLLDKLSIIEIEALAPVGNEKTLVSRLREGASVTLNKNDCMIGLEQMIEECQNEDIDTILVACTGKFDTFESDIPIVYPDYLLSHVVKGLFKEGELGIVVPLQEQAQSITEKWEDAGFTCSVIACSPYACQIDNLIYVAKEMDKLPIKAIVLDCMGYTDEMKRIMTAHTSKPILVARNIVFSTLAEMM